MNTAQVIDSDSNMILNHQITVYPNCIVAEIWRYTWYTRSSNVILDHAYKIVPLQSGPLGAFVSHKIPCIFLIFILYYFQQMRGQNPVLDSILRMRGCYSTGCYSETVDE